MASANQQGRSAGSSRSAGRGATKRASSGKGAANGRLIDYPRAGKSGVRRWLPSWRLVLGVILAAGFMLLGLVVAAYATTTIPEADEFALAETTTVRYANNADGTPGAVMGTFAEQKRVLVDATTLPEHVGHAVVASEDSSFYENAGVDPVGIVRAFVNNVKGGATQGASTITQQYVERYYNGKTTSDYVGKFREALLAVKISQSQDKEVVLGNYLNTIYFGRGTYGIQAASQAYFAVDAKDLTVAQGALLAGIIPSPSNWDPKTNPERAQQRWERVLDRMVLGGWLTAEERAAQVYPETIEPTTSQTFAGPQGYLLAMVKAELIDKASFTEDQINRVGLDVVTTIEQPLQAAAEAAVTSLRDGSLAGEAPNAATKVGLTSIDPADGAIVALYGGPDYITSAQNAATQDVAQAGSTFKPFTLVAALENGVSLSDTFSGKSPQKIEGWESETGKVTNFGSGGGQSFGTIDLVKATAESVNTVYAQLNIQVGPDKTAEVAHRAGITTDVTQVPSNVLGSDAVHPLDLASAYATFAAQGYHAAPFIVREAKYLKDGGIAYQGAGAREQVFAPEVMADATYAMTQVVETGSGKKWVKPLGRPIAGKTGTSSDNKSAWFVGYTPQLATSVAFYQPTADGLGEDPISEFGGVAQITGGTWPAKLWAAYMKPVLEVPKYAEVVDFPERSNVNKKKPTATATPTPTAEPTPTEEAPVAPTESTVPAGLVGMTRADAEAAIINAGLSAGVTEAVDATVPKGRVISASPAAGASAAPGSTVAIVISLGPAVVPATPVEPTPAGPPAQ
ncbi:transglycosylase domain-containing protein [Pengzhenrongella frigida]|uniref:PASTA domain-containing protein n=1 Tax=Pengzhenrongella frigida TaxID=1259133 RepID=A0A4Q5N4Z2_9MICO|nr:transglycosylase domain-containing protein [Cellulomonas sp. HLT2-17]RYV51101.1 PASTA domain-containing protein [Cellulomonas sp. HLT2-17]